MKGIQKKVFVINLSKNGYLIVATGWPKSNVPKVRAYCSASDHRIRKICSGVCRDSHWFEEYVKTIEIGDHFFE